MDDLTKAQMQILIDGLSFELRIWSEIAAQQALSWSEKAYIENRFNSLNMLKEQLLTK
ncbi:hypothetical protein [Leptospira johnsonii]|uniref:Uncharacterized protein n=1 Tax=Leptospira johnsonii TaxID=1917820 RepID=A0A2P2D7U9_9LEPT|nr:hypothetical protein [Leptospira johnsonii]GBF40706.1 hypothetical protein LPTSP1_37240 [Leptospira johnsonii]